MDPWDHSYRITCCDGRPKARAGVGWPPSASGYGHPAACTESAMTSTDCGRSLGDARACRVDDFPVSPEGIDPLAVRHARRRVGYEGIERMTVIGDLGGPVLALGRAEQALQDAVCRSWGTNGGQGRLVPRTRPITGGCRACVTQEEIQGPTVASDEDLSQSTDAAQRGRGARRRSGRCGRRRRLRCGCRRGESCRRRCRRSGGCGSRGWRCAADCAGGCRPAGSEDKQTERSAQHHKVSFHRSVLRGHAAHLCDS
jgi:hypothetical protein